MAFVAALLVVAGLASGTTISTTEPALDAIERAQATTVPRTWTSNVTGKAFDRFYHIWLENVVCFIVCCPMLICIKSTDLVTGLKQRCCQC